MRRKPIAQKQYCESGSCKHQATTNATITDEHRLECLRTYTSINHNYAERCYGLSSMIDFIPLAQLALRSLARQNARYNDITISSPAHGKCVVRSMINVVRAGFQVTGSPSLHTSRVLRRGFGGRKSNGGQHAVMRAS